MTEAAQTIASGLNSLMQQLDSVSHNVANAGTSGYKRQVTSFHLEYEKYLDAMNGDSTLNNNPIQAEQRVDFSQGVLRETQRALDLGLDGKGFLVVESPDGTLYTRNGCIQINELGQLVDLNGYIVAGENGPINLPPTLNEADLSISSDGAISGGGGTIGKLRLVDFGADEDRLIPAGMGVFQAPSDLRPSPAEKLKVRQGYQEGSNVKMVEEMVSMITLSRLYEANMNILRRQRENSQAVMSVANS